MSKTDIIARMRPDGVLVRVKPDGAEEVLQVEPLAAMTPEQTEKAARADGDTRPLMPEDFQRMRRVPRVKTLRRALGLTLDEFAARYHIPLGTLHDWEQGRSEPEEAARAYLTVIAHDPEGVRRALQTGPGDRRR